MLTLLAVVALAGTPPTPELNDAVSPATAQAWQKLSAETARFNKERSAACPGGAWRNEDPRALSLQINQCGGMSQRPRWSCWWARSTSVGRTPSWRPASSSSARG